MTVKSIPLSQIVLSLHAAERMEERGISIQELELIFLKPDQIINQGPKLIFQKKIKGRGDNDIAAVVLERKEKKLWVVITVLVNFQNK